MSNTQSHVQEQPRLTLLQGGKEEAALKDADPRRTHARDFLAPLALYTTVAAIAGAGIVTGAVKLGESLFSGGGRPVPSVKELKDFPDQVTVIPVTPEAASAGASAIGGLIDPQVYKTSSTLPGTEASNLNTMIGNQGPDVPGAPFKVPVLDPKVLSTTQINSPDFIVEK
jgi:hypothetical protein